MVEFRVEPAVYRKISEINPNLDSRVRIVGKIIDFNEDAIVIDDGSGKINISYSEDIPKPELSIGMLVRIFGFIIPSEPTEIRAEIIQDFSKLNIKYINLLK